MGGNSLNYFSIVHISAYIYSIPKRHELSNNSILTVRDSLSACHLFQATQSSSFVGKVKSKGLGLLAGSMVGGSPLQRTAAFCSILQCGIVHRTVLLHCSATKVQCN